MKIKHAIIFLITTFILITIFFFIFKKSPPVYFGRKEINRLTNFYKLENFYPTKKILNHPFLLNKNLDRCAGEIFQSKKSNLPLDNKAYCIIPNSSFALNIPQLWLQSIDSIKNFSYLFEFKDNGFRERLIPSYLNPKFVFFHRPNGREKTKTNLFLIDEINGNKYYECKTRLNGKSSMISPRPSLKLFFSNKVSFLNFNWPKSKKFIIHSSGGDGFHTLIKTFIFTNTAYELGLRPTKTEFINLIIDKVYFGIYTLSPDFKTIYKSEKKIKILNEKDFSEIVDLNIENRFLLNHFNLELLMRYFIFQVFIKNDDWPQNNVCYFFQKDEIGTAFPIPFDFDNASNFSQPKWKIQNPFIKIYNSNTKLGVLFRDIVNDSIKLQKFEKVLFSQLGPENNLNSIIESYINIAKSQLKYDIGIHTKYWSPPISEKDWLYQLDKLKIGLNEQQTKTIKNFILFKERLNLQN